jgi:hypothetical protein
MAAKPNEYAAPSNMPADTSFNPRPDQWGQQPPPIDDHIVSHAAYDELQEGWDGGGTSLADGLREPTLDDPWQ